MKIIKVENAAVGSHKAYNLLVQGLQTQARVLGLATGSTPILLYQEMAHSELDFSHITTINLDEYLGLDANNPQSYHYFMKQHLFQFKSFSKNYLPNGLAPDINQELQRYDQVIADHPIAIQILGIGQNGHIGFNEPGTSFQSQTHCVTLSSSTRAANARFFPNKQAVPQKAISMGLSSIMHSQHIILMAWGKEKAEAVSQMINGPITEKCPASILQKHPHTTIILDSAAAAKLN
ncbi:MAG: glucosamine-6-phosphate deaminase [Bombilactobacillus mellis]|nr:glucosamine-6-phosphate deaminase [Bombilactobacillus mellis]